ncbi:hypothetical protein [Streptomyces sp. NPDC050560]|uniref:hypothetical protein n=1 Tax=Streptomyces sp. NPDC050560 TaxID=3365630 RepID=UPI0037A02DEA
MNALDYVDDQLSSVLKCWRFAPGGRPGTVSLTGRQYFADGDGVRVLIRVAGEEALASDGGVMAARLTDAGVDIAGSTRAGAAWREILAQFELRELDGRIVGRRPLRQADQLASDIASAMLTADGLRWLALPERESKLTKQLYDFLRAEKFSFTRRPTISLPRGSKVKPTARVTTPKREVLIQTVAGGEQGIEHALSLVQRIDRASYTFDQRLVLLKGVPGEWPADHLDLLAEHTPVGFSARMEQVQAFLGKGKKLPSPVEGL